MTITQQRVTCKCGHVFEAEMVANAPIAVWIAAANAIRCPKCGSNEVGLGGGYNDAPPLTESIEKRAAWWIERGEVGTSSQTIWCVLAGGYPPGWGCDVPRDPDDFRRCHLLLTLIPEWSPRIGEVAERFPWFKPFSDRWGEFTKLFIEELPRKSCPKLYEAMRVARAETEALRRAGAAA